MNAEKQWYYYRPTGKSYPPQVTKEPCTFEEALQKAWELQKMIDEKLPRK
ncbi:MAG: hypothetical protein ACK5FG_00380 [Chryseotalea sp.]